MSDARCVVDDKNLLAEGPVWSEEEQALYWLDCLLPRPALHRWHPASDGHDQWPLSNVVASLALRENGGVLLAARTGIHFFDPDTGELELACALEADKPMNRCNDGKCDRKGRFWVGTMQNNVDANGEEVTISPTAGSLFRFDPDGRHTRMDSGFGISNTLAWSPDNETMYFGDTMAASIYAYDFDLETGDISNRRLFVQSTEHGYGDGSTIDREGFLWNARWDGGCLLRFAPDGRIDRVVPLPVQRPTSCAFGGENLDILYVTSARFGLSASELADQPQAGGIFAVDAGVRGLPEPRFAG